MINKLNWILIFLITVLNCFGQNDSIPIFSSPDKQTLKDYLDKNVQYPMIAIYNGVAGYVQLSFKINGHDSIIDAKVIRGVYEPMDKESLRILKSTNGMWTNTSNSKVSSEMAVGIKFDITAQSKLNSVLKDYKKANKFYDKGDYNNAMNLFKSVLDQRPNDLEVQFKLAQCFYNLGRIDEACKLIINNDYSESLKFREKIM